MAKLFEVCLLATLLVAAARASTLDNKVEELEAADVDNLEVGSMPSLLGMLGSKVSVGENIYDEYSADADDSTDDDDDSAGTDDSVEVEAEPTAPCCFPKVWQGRLKSDFGFVPVGGRRGGRDSDDDESDKKGKKHKGGKKKGGDKRGRPLSARAIDQVYVDGNNRRLAGDKTVFVDRPGKPLNFSYLVLLGANRTADLYLFNRSAQKCRHRKLANIDWHQQCLPPNATLRGQFSLGPAAGGLRVQSWGIEAGSRRMGASIVSSDAGSDNNVEPDSSSDEDDVDDDEEFGAAPTTTKRPPRPRPKPRPRVFVGANVLVVPGSCTPVVIQEQGIVLAGGRGDESDFDYINAEVNKDGKKPKPKPKPSKAKGEAFIGSVYFSDVKNSISDPSVFKPPSYCTSTPNTLYFDNMEDELPALLERFLVL